MGWQKGQSGNPAGRKPIDGAIRNLARQNSPEAIERLIEWMRSDNPKASVSACNAILDRAYGKPPQAIVGGSEDDPPIRQILKVELVDLR